ncbi:MAG TPA: tetratricopeptide repeat protein [Phycisphaerae bacterium]|nr:tetratricopeptide repeat protein [Phycisphaerae bacterium]
MFTMLRHLHQMEVGDFVPAKARTVLLCIAVLISGGCGKPKPDYAELMKNGRREYDARRYVEAVAMFREAAEFDTERAEPAYCQGLCYMAIAKEQFRENELVSALRYTDRAIAAFDSAVGAFPGYTAAVQGKADALKLKGKHQAALEIANWAAAQSAFHPNLMKLKAHEYSSVGDMDKAQLTFEQAVALDPDNAAMFAELGLFYMRCGNDTEAVKCLKRAYELNPHAPGVAAALAHLGALSDVR